MRARRLVAAVPVAVAVLWVVAVGPSAGRASTTGPSSRDTSALRGDPTRGRALYQTGCSSCHGLAGEGTDQAPSLRRVGAASVDFYVSTGRMPADQPEDQAPRKKPAYSRRQTDDLVAYVASTFGRGGPGIPRLDPADGDLSLGNQLYSLNCAACHNSAGSGGALGHDTFAPALTSATPRQVAEAIRVGPGAMPVFGPSTLSDHQVKAIMRYTQQLRRPDDRGGLSLGRVGPITEGFVAWLVGLGALLLAARLIGTNR